MLYGMEGVITLKDALQAMNSGELFSMRWVTFDRKRKTGGEIKEESGCKLSGQDYREQREHNPKGVQAPSSKLPAHYRNRTRNIVLPNGDVRKVNIWFIIGFNGKKVALY